MRLLLLGATGRTGKWILEQALQQGHSVHALVRDRNKVNITHERLTVFEGSPTNIDALTQAINSCEAVISVLNISRASEFPWSTLRTPPTLLSDTMRILIPLCEERFVRRIVVCSAWGVAETKKDLPAWFRWFIDHSNIGPAYADHERQEKLLEESTLNWTIVRPTGLTNGKKEKPVRSMVGSLSRPRLTISRKNLAGFMVNQLGQNEYSRKAVTVSH